MEFLAELYLSHANAGGAREAAARARAAADELSLRFVRTTFLPGDDTCFVVFEAEAAETVAEAGRRAGLAFERIVPAIEAT